MDIPAEWLSSQVVLGAILVVLAVVGVLFFFRTGTRKPSAPVPADGDGGHGHGDADDEDHGHGDAADRSGPGTYGPIAPVEPASVFETEPCWMGLLPGRSRPGPDASTGRGPDEPTDPQGAAPPARS